jgi:DNA-binding response OmpR family regulator
VAVIDDDPDLLRLMEEVLTEEGYDADLMRGFEDAHAHVGATQPALVICDLVVKDEERGWEVIERIKRDPRTATIPLIVCSAAVTSLAERRESLARRGIRSIPKPFEVSTLLAVIREVIGPQEHATRM